MAKSSNRQTELLFVLTAILSLGLFSLSEFIWGGIVFLQPSFSLI